MTEPIKLNLNDQCSVVVTERGVQVMRDFYAKLGLPDMCQQMYPNLAPGYVLRTELHNVMQMFGSSLYNGCKIPIETAIEVTPR